MVGASVAKATVIQIGTGLDASGNLIYSGATEQNYAITGPEGEVSATATVAAGAWVANQPTGQRITPVYPGTSTLSQGAGLFTYTRTLDGIGSMSGELASDNGGNCWSTVSLWCKLLGGSTPLPETMDPLPSSIILHLTKQ